MLAFFSKTDDYIQPSYDEGCGKEMPDLHYHHSYEIYLLTKGKRTYLIDDSLYEINEGDVILIPPMKLHKTLGKDEYERYLITFTDNYLSGYFTKDAKEMLLSCFASRCIHLEGYKLHSMKYFIEKIMQSYEKKDNMSFIYFSNIMAILTECMQTSANIQPLTSNTNKTILSIIEYIDANYKTISTIEQIANEHFITKYHLCRMFKTATDISLVKYINTVKIHKACKLLDNTNKNITEIAYETGFNSSMYFCKTFKSLMGMTPTEYKKHLHPGKKNKTADNTIYI